MRRSWLLWSSAPALSACLGCAAVAGIDAEYRECASALTYCAGTCADTRTDPRNCGACGHDCLATECAGSTCQPVLLADGQSRPFGVTAGVDDVFWANADSGTIMRVSRAGGKPETVVSGQETPFSLALDETHIYWVNSTHTGSLARVPLAGGPVQRLIEGQLFPLDLAVTGGEVYWNNNSGTVMKMLSQGGNATTLFATTALVTGLAVDATSVYWAVYNVNPAQVYKVSRGGGEPTPLGAVPSPGMPGGLAVHGPNIYWTAAFGPNQIFKAPIDVGQRTLLFSGPDSPGFLAADDTFVYWTSEDGALRKVPHDGGPATVLASGGSSGGAITVDATYVYWTDAMAGNVWKVVK